MFWYNPTLVHGAEAEDSLGNWTFDHLAHCERIEIIGEAMEHASIYLYPFIIEYSIIGISVMYRWGILLYYCIVVHVG